MKRKNLLFNSLVAVGALTIVGCGGGGSDPTPTGPINIYVHCQYGKGPRGLLDQFAAEFNTANKQYNVIVDQEISGTYKDVFGKEKLFLQDQASDDWGDLVVCYPDHVVDYMMTFKAAADLSGLINDPEIGISTKDMNDFTESARDQFSIEFPKSGKYVLPFSTSTECMFYNPAVLGIQIEGVNGGEPIDEDYINSLTWDEFLGNFAPKFKDYNAGLEKKIWNPDGNENYGLLGVRDEDNFFITLCEQHGYSYTHVDEVTADASIDFNVKGVRDITKRFAQAKADHYFITDGSVQGGISSWFKTGQCLFYIGSTGGIQYTQTAIEGVDWEIECGRLPQASNEISRQKMISQGGSWCILKHAQYTEQRIRGAWLFYKYITEEKQCLRWAATSGYYPIRKTVTSKPAWGKVIDEYDEDGNMKTGIDLLTARNAKYCATYDNILFTNDVFIGSAYCREQVESLFVKILTASPAEYGDDEWLLSQFDATVTEIKKNM